MGRGILSTGEGEQGIGKNSMRQLADESSSLTAFKNNFMTTAGFYKDPETGELGEMVEVEWDYDQEQVASINYTDAIAALNDRLHSSGASLDSIWSGNDPDIEDSDEPRQYLLELIGIHQS